MIQGTAYSQAFLDDGELFQFYNTDLVNSLNQVGSQPILPCFHRLRLLIAPHLRSGSPYGWIHCPTVEQYSLHCPRRCLRPEELY